MGDFIVDRTQQVLDLGKMEPIKVTGHTVNTCTSLFGQASSSLCKSVYSCGPYGTKESIALSLLVNVAMRPKGLLSLPHYDSYTQPNHSKLELSCVGTDSHS